MINFFCGALPANDPILVANCLNWIDDNGFEMSAVFNVFLPAPLAAPNGSPQMMSMVYIFAAGDEATFLDYFGREYSEEIVREIPKMIADIETAGK